MITKQLSQTVIIFVALAIAGVLLIVLPHQSSSAQADLKEVMPLVGSALFSSGLTFFLVQMFNLRKVG